MEIRRYEKEDTVEIMTLFKKTIISINLKDYTKEQVSVWANGISGEEAWMKRLGDSTTYVVSANQIIVGFGNLTEKGEIDLLYTHKDYQRQGIGRMLIVQLEKDARLNGILEVFTEASITAKPFFEAKGYEVYEKQSKRFNQIEFINFIMKKRLSR